MAIVETFQKRMKRLAEQGQVEVLQCENLPYGFRVQVIHIWATAIGPWFDVPEWEPRQPPPSNRIWGYVHSTPPGKRPGAGTISPARDHPDLALDRKHAFPLRAGEGLRVRSAEETPS